MIIKLTKEQIDLLDNGIKITNDVNTYRFLPFWFSSTEREDEFNILTFEQLPKDLQEHLHQKREKADSKNFTDNMSNIEMNQKDYEHLKSLYDNAVKYEKDSFIFKDVELLTSYAKYLIEFLKPKYEK